MIALTKVLETERLLAEGRLSQRKIAHLIGISRATVGAIAAGKRPDYEARRALRAAELEPPGPIERCPGCGGLVHMPCRLCRVRKLKERERDVARAARRRQRQAALRSLLLAVLEANRQCELTAEADCRPRAACSGVALTVTRGEDSSLSAHLPAEAMGGALDCK